jgi:fatty-acid desaturase
MKLRSLRHASSTAGHSGSGAPSPREAKHRIAWVYAIALISYHLLALLALVPWLFSWAGVAAAGLGLYVFGTLGINLCYHRLLTHRGFACPQWLERSFAVLGVCCLQDTPARWVAVHRRHHEHSDEPGDPHSPTAGFFWSHMGWLLVEGAELARFGVYDRYAKDLLAEPFYRQLLRRKVWIGIVLASWAIFFAGGFLGALLTGAPLPEATRLGASLLVWGVFLRTVLVWHITWSINSFCHVWGRQRYDTGERSRNNILIALLSNGEGWHNNHHADQRAARHGHRWWELDVTWITIRLLAVLGLARRIALPGAHLPAMELQARRAAALPPRS